MMGRLTVRIPWKKAAVAALVSLPFVILGIGWLVRQAERRGWEKMRIRVARLITESRSQSLDRPALKANPLAGNACDSYGQAFECITLAINEDRNLYHSLYEKAWYGKPIERIEYEGFVNRCGCVMDHLREGARREKAQAPNYVDLSVPPSSPHAFFVPCISRLWPVAILKARLLLTEGHPTEAAELLTDLCLFGRDVTHNTILDHQGAGGSALKAAVDELRQMLVDGAIPAETFPHLERELRSIDAIWPDRALTLKNETARLGQLLLASGSSTLPGKRGTFDIPRGGALEQFLGRSSFEMPRVFWRHWLSEELFLIDLFNSTDDWMVRGGVSEVKPWKEAQEIHAAIRSDALWKPGPFSSFAIEAYAWSASLRASRAKLRMLVTALHYRMTGQVLNLEDPLGKTLHARHMGEGKLRLWSEGNYAMGEPEPMRWKHPDHDPNHLVLDVRR